MSFLGLLGHIKLLCGLNPFIEQSETLEKMGAERPGVLVLEICLLIMTPLLDYVTKYNGFLK